MAALCLPERRKGPFFPSELDRGMRRKKNWKRKSDNRKRDNQLSFMIFFIPSSLSPPPFLHSLLKKASRGTGRQRKTEQYKTPMLNKGNLPDKGKGSFFFSWPSSEQSSPFVFNWYSGYYSCLLVIQQGELPVINIFGPWNLLIDQQFAFRFPPSLPSPFSPIPPLLFARSF